MSERNVHPQNQNEFKRLLHLHKIDMVVNKDYSMNKKLIGNEFINLCNSTQNLGGCINSSVDVDLINNVSRNISLQNV